MKGRYIDMGRLRKTLFAAIALTMAMSTAAYADDAPKVIYDPSVSGVTDSSNSGSRSERGFIDEAGLQLINDAQARQTAADSMDALMKMKILKNFMMSSWENLLEKEHIISCILAIKLMKNIINN